FLQQPATAHSTEVPTSVARVDDDAHLRHARPQLQILLRRRRNDNRHQILLLADARKQIHSSLGIGARLTEKFELPLVSSTTRVMPGTGCATRMRPSRASPTSMFLPANSWVSA